MCIIFGCVYVVYMDIHLYVCRERERERDVYICSRPTTSEAVDKEVRVYILYMDVYMYYI